MVQIIDWISSYFLAYKYLIVIIPLVERLSFPSLNFLCTFAQNQLSINMTLFLHSLFHSIDLFLCFDNTITIYIYIYIVLLLLGLNLESHYFYFKKNLICYFCISSLFTSKGWSEYILWYHLIPFAGSLASYKSFGCYFSC